MSGKERYARRPSSNTAPSPGATELLSAPTFGGQVTVTVFGYSSDMFGLIIDEIYSSMEGTWYDTTRSALPVERDDFRTYCMMAARTRIARVNNERRTEWSLRTNDDWAIPSQIANVIGSVGKVFMDETATTLVPVWPSIPLKSRTPELEDLDTAKMRSRIQDENFFVVTTGKMRRIKSHFDRLPGVPIIFVDHIASEVEGDPDVMCLVPAYATSDAASEGEGPVRLHARAASDRMVNGTVAFNYLAWALMPGIYQRNHVGLHPMENLGGRYIEVQAVNSTWMRLLAKAVS